MKQWKAFVGCTLAALSVFSLAACGEKGGGASTGDLEALKTNVQAAFDGLEELDYSKFSLRYEENSNIIWEKVELDYDADGYFHSKQYMDEKVVPMGQEAEEYTVETYMWVDGSTLTRSYYYKKVGYNNNVPEKKYWVKECGSNEGALEEFEWFLAENHLNDINFLERHPSDYVLLKDYELLEMANDDLEYYLSSKDERISYTLTSNTASGFHFSRKFNDATYTMVVENGYLTSYVEDDPVIWKRNLALSFDWTFEAPDLSTYTDWS